MHIEGGTVAVDTEVRHLQCPTHGTVPATRDVPKLGFPFVVTFVRRARARHRPFHCPTCGAPVG